MLKKFEVTNFKNFQETLSFDLSTTQNYDFNPECVRNGIVKTALIYGVNGSGKTNLGHALLDMIENLIDDRKKRKVPYYLSAHSEIKFCEFKYTFLFDGKEVIYQYQKNNDQKIMNEKLIIDGDIVIDYKVGNNFYTSLLGTEHLNKFIDPDLNLSVCKYIYNNTIMADSCEKNKIFKDFFVFSKSAVFWRGISSAFSVQNMDEAQNEILEDGRLGDFERFINDCGVQCRLVEMDHNDQKTIGFYFDQKVIPFSLVASTGTKFILFIYILLGFIAQNKCSFVFIDEFDASFHFDLSYAIAEKLKNTDIQVILTTHNTNLLSNDLIRPDCAFVLDGKMIKPLHELTDKNLRFAHGLEKMYRAGMFNHD